MQGMISKYLCIVVLGIAGFMLAGCIGTNPVTPTQFYILNSTIYDSSLVDIKNQGVPLSVELTTLHLPKYLEKLQIVTRASDNRLEMAEYHQWGGSLRKNMIRVLSLNLSRLLATPYVDIPPFHSTSRPDFRIKVEVMRFEADKHGRVWLTAKWRLSRGNNNLTLAKQVSKLKGPDPHSSYDMDTIVLDMEGIWGKFCITLGEEILTHTAEAKQQ